MGSPGKALVLLLAFLALSGQFGGVAEAASLGGRYAALDDGNLLELDPTMDPKLTSPAAASAAAAVTKTALAKTGTRSQPATLVSDTCRSAECEQFLPCKTPSETAGLILCTQSDYQAATSAATALCRPGQRIDSNIASRTIPVTEDSEAPAWTQSSWSCVEHNYESACLDCRGKCMDVSNPLAGYVPVQHVDGGSAAAGTDVICPGLSETPAASCPGAAPVVPAPPATCNSPLGCPAAAASSPFAAAVSSPPTTPFTPAVSATATAATNIGATPCDSPLGCPKMVSAGCAATVCPADVCGDGMGRRPIGDNCCACPDAHRGCAPYCTAAVDAFRITSSAPNRLTADEYTACQGDKWKCTSYCSDCPAGTFDVMHAVGLDSNCINKADGEACGTACGYIDGATGGMWCSAGIGLSSSPNACQIRGRHDCPAGFGPPDRTEVAAKSNHCHACQAGKFSPGGLTAAGTTFLGTMGATGWTVTDMATLFGHAQTCQDCPAGKVSGRGASECTACASMDSFGDSSTPNCVVQKPDGTNATLKAKWYANNDRTDCECCPAGSGLITPTNQCMLCGLGTFGSGDGTCQSCPTIEGKYSDAMGLTACKTCSGVLKVDAATTSLYCDGCNDNMYWPNGATQCQTCEAGSYTSGGTEVTVDGEVRRTSHVACDACPAGHSCDGSPTKSECTKGTYSSGGAPQCTVCPTSSYTDSSMSTGCTPCPAGRYQPASADDDAARHDSPDDCLVCQTGKFSASPGATSCATCATCAASEGKAYKPTCAPKHDAQCECKTGWAGDGLSCTRCAGNTYSDANGVTACKTCASGAVGATAVYTCSTYNEAQTNCGGTATTDTGSCPGGSKVKALDPVAYYYLTGPITDESTGVASGGDWPPYKCDDTYASNFPGNAQCVADVCDGNFVEGSPSIWTTMEKTGTCASPTGKVCTTGSTAAACALAAINGGSAAAEYTCDVRCKEGYYSDPSNPLVASAVCRNGGESVAGDASPLYQGPVSTQCLPGKCPTNTKETVQGEGIIGGCDVLAGYGGSITKTYEGATVAEGTQTCEKTTCTHTITRCVAGTASALGSATCDNCADGQYSAAGATTCTACTECSGAQLVTTECSTTTNRACENKGICTDALCTGANQVYKTTLGPNHICPTKVCTTDECCQATPTPTPTPTPTGDPPELLWLLLLLLLLPIGFAIYKYTQRGGGGGGGGLEEEEEGQGWWDALFGSDEQPAGNVAKKVAGHAATAVHDAEEGDDGSQEEGDAAAEAEAEPEADADADADAATPVHDAEEGDGDAQEEGTAAEDTSSDKKDDAGADDANDGADAPADQVEANAAEGDQGDDDPERFGG